MKITYTKENSTVSCYVNIKGKINIFYTKTHTFIQNKLIWKGRSNSLVGRLSSRNRNTIVQRLSHFRIMWEHLRDEISQITKCSTNQRQHHHSMNDLLRYEPYLGMPLMSTSTQCQIRFQHFYGYRPKKGKSKHAEL